MGFNQLFLPLFLHMVILVELLPSSAPILASVSFPIAKHGCDDRCGNVSIPFPFGTKEGCYLNEDFFINCSHSSNNAPQPFLGMSSIEVLNTSLAGQYLRLSQFVAYDCYNQDGSRYSHNSPWMKLSERLTFNSTANKFTTVGCDTYSIVDGLTEAGSAYVTGCAPYCKSKQAIKDGSCGGIGCCQTSIPPGAWNINVSLTSNNNHTDVWSFNRCGYAFVVEDGSFQFFADNLTNLDNVPSLPLVVDWTIDNTTCEAAKKNTTSYACSTNSGCEDVEGLGYRCWCDGGYEGNPYLPGGCQDIDECKDNRHKCTKNSTCSNTPGSYACPCVKGYQGNGSEGGGGCSPHENHNETIHWPMIVSGGDGCFPDKEIIHWSVIVTGSSVGFVVLFLMPSGFASYKVIKKRRNKKRKEKFFKRNGGLLLQQQLSADEGGIEKTMIFTATELKKATDGFNENRILGQGGQGTVYKGMLTDGRIVAIKKSKKVDGSQLEQFINEVVILSQINHRNVVKLLGACLETEVPLLVYEFIPNGTLFSLIHNGNDDEFPLTWNLRLRIATEVAGALAYLHSAISIPIYHRDIKSSNILLDEKYRAKVSDFGISRSIATDKTHLTTRVQGTFGYLDPEFFQSSQFTDKSDVYSFGVVLVELLTRQMPVSSSETEESGKLSLARRFLESMEKNSLNRILDPQIIDQKNEEQIVAIAKLAQRCLNLNGKRRPTMKEAAIELESITMSNVDSTIQANFPNPSCFGRDSTILFDSNYTRTRTTESDSFALASDDNPLLFDTA